VYVFDELKLHNAVVSLEKIKLLQYCG